MNFALILKGRARFSDSTESHRALAEMLDAPLPLLTAELYGGGGLGGELQALAENFMAIQHPASREAVLTLVFALGDAASAPPPDFGVCRATAHIRKT